MSDINYKNNRLHVENVALDEIAKKTGTPVFIYSKAMLEKRLNAYMDALNNSSNTQRQHKVFYAVKANANLSLLREIAKMGAAFDIVSQGELERIIMAGADPEKVVFSGVGKLPAELKRALDVGVSCFNIESEAELLMLEKIADDCKKVANISLRVNPDVDAETHPYISTGLKENKFGIDITRAESLYQKAFRSSHLCVTGIACHIGSQLTSVQPFLDAMDRLLELVDKLEQQNITLSHIDMGGGLGIAYEGEVIPSIETYVNALCTKLGNRKLSLHLEPGRSLVAEAGVLLTQVILTKKNSGKYFAIVDAGMNDLVRPALYQAKHAIRPVNLQTDKKLELYDIVGPVCETADCFAKRMKMALSQGDYLAIMDSGAYGSVMSSNYNARPRAPEVIINENDWHIIRRRETFADMISIEMTHSSGG